ncbi:MAG: hypothetical protein ACTSRU_17505 [Candidatus Hodarchaeales archaeon]
MVNISGYKLPKSSVKVLSCIITSDEGMCPSAIIAYTNMSERTVRYALKRLRDNDLVEVKISLNDLRYRTYRIKRNLNESIAEVMRVKGYLN